MLKLSGLVSPGFSFMFIFLGVLERVFDIVEFRFVSTIALMFDADIFSGMVLELEFEFELAKSPGFAIARFISVFPMFRIVGLFFVARSLSPVIIFVSP